MSKLNEVVSLYKQLKSEWGSTNPNLSKCEQLLADLKVIIIKVSRVNSGNTY